MKVARYYSNNDIRIEDIPVPKIGAGELLVRVKASGICGSDVMEWYRIKKAPLVLGHEIAGVIEKVGEGVKNFKAGDRVFVSHHVPCGECHYCMNGHESVCEMLRATHFDPGGFSEFIRVPEINVKLGTFFIPDTLSDEEGTFIEPLACVARGQRLLWMMQEKSVLVIGSGITGVLHVQYAKARGAGFVAATDMNEYRMDFAKKLGADVAFHAKDNVPEKIREANGGRLCDFVIVCTGAVPAISQAWQCVDRGGTVLLFAPPSPDDTIPFPLSKLWPDEITIVTSYAGAPRDIAGSIDILRLRRVNVRDMITHRLPLSDAARGFKLVSEAGESMKVVLVPND